MRRPQARRLCGNEIEAADVFSGSGTADRVWLKESFANRTRRPRSAVAASRWRSNALRDCVGVSFFVVHAQVFISYARRSSGRYAQALRDALAEDGVAAFLDTADIEAGAAFTPLLRDAILQARVFVLFGDTDYFRSWYCLREMRLALAEFEARVVAGASDDARREALVPLVIARHPENLSESDLGRMPPALRATNWPLATETATLADLVRRRLQGWTLAERQLAAGVPADVQAAIVDESRLPPPTSLAGLSIYPAQIGASLGAGFIGRHDELWRLDLLLSTGRGDATRQAAPTVALHGGGGAGKTQLVREYVLRFGRDRFPGGIFWVDASGAIGIEEQHHGIWQALDLAHHVAPLAELRARCEDVARLLATALHHRAAAGPALVVVDNVPESMPGQAPQPLRTWCPAQPGDVAVLATSRRRLDIGAPRVDVLHVGVLPAQLAVDLLRRGFDRHIVGAAAWHGIAEAVGGLPLALTLLNEAFKAGIADVGDVACRLANAGVLIVLDEQAQVLKEFVGDVPVRAVSEAFQVSFDLLDDDCKALAEVCALLAPAPIPQAFCDVLEGPTPNRLAIARLAARAILDTHGADADASVTMVGQMHRVLAAFLRTRSRFGDQHPLLAIRMLALSIGTVDGDDPLQWALLRASLPHVREVMDQIERVWPKRVIEELDAQLFHQLAAALQAFADAEGDRVALLQAVRIRRLGAQLFEFENAPDDWAFGQVQLAVALRKLGDRTPGEATATEVERICLAVMARRESISKQLILSAVAELALACDALGRSAQAIALHRESIASIDRSADPIDWARAMLNLGVSLANADAEIEQHLQQAAQAYRAALDVFAQQDDRTEWAHTQANLAGVLFDMAQADDSAGGLDLLRESIERLRLALGGLTLQRRPRDWAQTQRQLGDALDLLAVREGGPQHRSDAFDAYFAALDAVDRESDPHAWAQLNLRIGDLARTLISADMNDGDEIEIVQVALDAFACAAEVFTREAGPARWAALQAARAELLIARARVRPDGRDLTEATTMLRGALAALSADDENRDAVEALLAQVERAR